MRIYKLSAHFLKISTYSTLIITRTRHKRKRIFAREMKFKPRRDEDFVRGDVGYACEIFSGGLQFLDFVPIIPCQTKMGVCYGKKYGESGG